MLPLTFSSNFRRILLAFLLGVLNFSSLQAQPKTASSNRPELALQIGHSQSVLALAYSPDGNFLASGAGEGTLKIWDAKSRDLIRTIPAHAGNLYSLAWTPSGSTLASAGADGIVKLWNPATGKLQSAIAARLASDKKLLPAFSCVFNGDGSTLAVGYGESSSESAHGELVFYNAREGKVKRVAWRNSAIFSLAFSPKNNLFASGGSDGVLRIWDATAGSLKFERDHSIEPISSLAFSPDGRSVAYGSWDKKVRVWEIGGETTRVLIGHNAIVQAVAFSPDGSTLVSSGIDRRVISWNVKADYATRETATLKLASRALAFAPGGSTLAVGSWSAIELRGPKTLETTGNFEERPRWTTTLSYSPDGKMLAAAGGTDGLIFLWDTRSGRLLRALKGSATIVHQVLWSPDGSLVAGVCGRDQRTGKFPIPVWRASDGTLAHNLPQQDAPVLSIAFSPDGSTLAVGGSDRLGPQKRGQIKMFQLKTGGLVRVIFAPADGTDALAFSSDGKTLLSAGNGADGTGILVLWNAQNGRAIRSTRNLTQRLNNIAFSRNESTLVVGDRDHSISIWSAKNGVKLKTLRQNSAIQSLAFSRDGSTLASGGQDALIRIWDAKTGKLQRVLRGHESSVRAISFSPDGSTLASGSLDTSTRLWKIRESRQLAALLTAAPELSERAENAQTLWLSTTPEGYYDAAEGADYLVKWRFGNRLLPFFHFEEAYRRPDILRRALAGERIAARPLLLSRVPPMIRIISPQRGQTLTGKSVRVLVEAADDEALENFKMFVNGVLVPDTVAKPIIVDGKPIIVDGKPIIVDGKPIIVDGKPIIVDGKPIVADGKPIVAEGKNLNLEVRPIVADGRPITADGRGLKNAQQYASHQLFVMDLPLDGGARNLVLRAVVTDNQQNKSDAAVMVKSAYSAPVQSDLHLLCVGISQYRNPNYNIGFAAADAKGIAGVLQAQRGRNYKNVHATILTDRQASAKNIRAPIGELKKAKPNDTVMVFLSGHGLRASGQFYFAPWGTFINDVPGTCLRWNELLGALDKVYARKLLFTDACFSGSKLGARQATSGELAELAQRESGLVMLSSSQADEFSFEDKSTKHGAFSLALMEAFAGKSDVDGDAEITLSEVALYVPRRVSTLTKGLQNPQLVFVQDFNPQTVLAKAP